MTFDDLAQYGFNVWLAARRKGVAPIAPLCVLGPPGIGKSAVAADIAARMQRHVQQCAPTPQVDTGSWTDVAARDSEGTSEEAVFLGLDLSSMLPEDLGGIPKTEWREVNGQRLLVTDYAIQLWLAPFCVEGAYGVLCLDDLPVAAPAVQVAVRQLVLYRRVGNFYLSPGVQLFVTGNRREDKSGAVSLPAHFRNCVQLLELDTDLGDWARWYGQQDGCAPIIPAFLQYKESYHSMLPKDADRCGAFATPRSWHLLGQLFKTAQETGDLLEVASSLVGEGIASELVGFVNVRKELVSPHEVLLSPEAALPNPAAVLSTPDRAYALMTGLGETAARWFKSKSDPHRADASRLLLRALGHATTKNREYIAIGVTSFVNNGGQDSAILEAARKHKADPLVKEVLTFLAQAMRGRS